MRKEKSKLRPITNQDKSRVSKPFAEAALWHLRTLMQCADKSVKNSEEVKFVRAMVDGFACWNLESIGGCGMKWISKKAKRWLVEEHGVDPALLVENFAISKTFDKYYPDDLELRNCLSNNVRGFKKRLVREHLTPKKEMKRKLEDWSIPASKIVEEDFDLALIAVEEDRELSKRGWAAKRPGGWRRCYRECGIELERLPPASTIS